MVTSQTTRRNDRQFDTEYHPFIFSPIYWHLIDALNDPNITYVYVIGGSSASKTYSIEELAAIEGMRQGFSTIIFRKEQTTHEDTTVNDLKEINDRLELEMYETKLTFTFPDGKNKIRLRGLDNPDKLKGLKGFRVLYCNETDQLGYEYKKELDRRIRGIVNPTIIFDLNPVSEAHWVNTKVYQREEWTDVRKDIPGRKYSRLHEKSEKKINKTGDTIWIKTSYRDNYYIVGHPTGNKNWGRVDKVTLRNFEKMALYEPDEAKVYRDGDWGTIRTGFEYYNKFTRARNVGKFEVIKDLPVHVTMDFNANPYMAAGVWQIDLSGERTKVIKVKEYAMKSPKNSVEDTIDAVVEDFEEIFRYGLFFYGDVDANRTTMLRDKRSFLMAIMESFKGYLSKNNVRIPNSNPLHSERRRLMNRAFIGGYDYDLFIDEECRYSIMDFEKVQTNINGAKKKDKDGNGHEKYGHFSDGDDYFVHFVHHQFLN